MRKVTVAAPMFAIAMILTACTGATDEGGSQMTTNSDETAGQAAQTDSGGTGAAGTVQLGTVNLHEESFELDWREAVNLAQAAFDGDVSEIELEADDTGKYHYKIEMLSDTEAYVRYVDAETATLVREERKDLDSEDAKVERLKDAIDLTAVVPLASAMDAARAVHPGPVNAWKLEGHAAGPRYTIDVNKAGLGHGDHEVLVDAKSGKIILGVP